MMRRISISGLMIAGLMAMGLGFANPAQAAATLTVVPGGIKVDGMVGPPTQDVVFCRPTATLLGCANGSPRLGGLFQSFANDTYVEGSDVASLSGTGATTLPAGTYTVVIRDLDPNAPVSFLASRTNVVIGSGTPSESSPQPQTLSLSINTVDGSTSLTINTVDGSTCRQSSESAFAGTWINLPAADDCTPPASRAGATLLGWATNPNFPVDIAQRQIDNGWGAYEMFNDEGRLTAVFIPAGGATYLSGDGNLFAIWSK
jgi:hypothetical protein